MQRQKLMKKAWALARQGARNFGAPAKSYFACALKLVWEESRKPAEVASSWSPGVGNRFVLPGVPLPTSRPCNGRCVLPGLHLQ